MAEGVKYFIIMLSELVLPCANDVDTNHTEGRMFKHAYYIRLSFLATAWWCNG